MANPKAMELQFYGKVAGFSRLSRNLEVEKTSGNGHGAFLMGHCHHSPPYLWFLDLQDNYVNCMGRTKLEMVLLVLKVIPCF